MTDDERAESEREEIAPAPDVPGPDVPAAPEAPVQYGVGPFSIREVLLGGIWLLAFVFSFFSITAVGFASVWTSGLAWILTIGAPTVAVFLIVLRRLSPDGIRRVGSLGIDQFASVAFSVAALLWLQMIWDAVAFAAAGGVWVRSWVIWLEFLLMLAGVIVTVAAPFIPGLREDFQHRPEAVARPHARPARPVAARPPAPAPSPAPAASPVSAASFAGDGGTQPVLGADASTEDVAAEEPVQVARSVHQAFWALVPEERDVHDERGEPAFRVGPTAWALVIEDRGEVFVVRHEDGRIGYLHDVSGVTRG